MGKLKSFTDIISGFIEKTELMDATFLTQEIIRESGIMREIFQDVSPEGMSRQENVQELLNGVQEFVSDVWRKGKVPTQRFPARSIVIERFGRRRK